MTGYGVYSVRDGHRRLGWSTGTHVVDLGELARHRPELARWLTADSLDPLLAAGRGIWAQTLDAILDWEPDADRVPLARVTSYLPFAVADYVDFYASEHHAANVGRLFRPGQEPLTPNWKHLPIGYHGRAGTVVVSGTDVVRPCGQRRVSTGSTTGESDIVFGPSVRLDIEAEVGYVVGVGSERGTPVPLRSFADHVFGVCLVNDWSARDIQAWEYVPLGPFLGKSFATSVGAWITPLGLLEGARVAPPARDPRLLSYLDDSAEPPWGLDLALEVRLGDQVLSRPPYSSMYWTGAQQLAHMTVNGASLRTGDLFASGTVSGPEPDQWGSLLEITRGGADPVSLRGGGRRTFLEDGDEVVITATAPGLTADSTVALAEVRGRILAAR